MREISLSEFIEGYEEGFISEVVVFRDKVYGKSVKSMAAASKPYEIVWARVP